MPIILNIDEIINKNYKAVIEVARQYSRLKYFPDEINQLYVALFSVVTVNVLYWDVQNKLMEYKLTGKELSKINHFLNDYNCFIQNRLKALKGEEVSAYLKFYIESHSSFKEDQEVALARPPAVRFLPEETLVTIQIIPARSEQVEKSTCVIC